MKKTKKILSAVLSFVLLFVMAAVMVPTNVEAATYPGGVHIIYILAER